MPREYPLKINQCPFADLSTPCPTRELRIWEQGKGYKILCKFQTKEKFIIRSANFSFSQWSRHINS